MEKTQVRSFEGVVYMTNATLEVANVTPKMLDEAGLKYSNCANEGFYPLTEAESKFVAEDWIDIGGKYPMMASHSVLLDGKKYLSLEDTIDTGMAEEFDHCIETENRYAKERAIEVASELGGIVLWSEEPSCEWTGHRKVVEKDFTTAVLVELEQVVKKHGSYDAWRNELMSLKIAA